MTGAGGLCGTSVQPEGVLIGGHLNRSLYSGPESTDSEDTRQ